MSSAPIHDSNTPISSLPAEETISTLRAKNRSLAQKNQQLVDTLKQTRSALHKATSSASDSALPLSLGTALMPVNLDNSSIVVQINSQRMSLPVISGLNISPGDLVEVNSDLRVVGISDAPQNGELATVTQVLQSESPVSARIIASDKQGNEHLLNVPQKIVEKFSNQRINIGDSVFFNSRSGWVIDSVQRDDTLPTNLELIQSVSYQDIGGLADQVEIIRDAIELPLLHPDLYKNFDMTAPKGVLLYGPPGCGKTLIAKAVASSLKGKYTADESGDTGEGSTPTHSKSYFINVKGPELLSKYVGEAERHIRTIFSQARKAASQGNPVVIFFDEIEALFRTRGTGKSSDTESTLVPQLLTELDGVESLDNVIVMGASNREDLIDPALLRPGRFDVKVHIDRPNKEQSEDILHRYLSQNLPFSTDLEKMVGSLDSVPNYLVNRIVEWIFSENSDTHIATLTHVSGTVQKLYLHDMLSGAVLANIIDYAKKNALKETLRHRSAKAPDGCVTLQKLSGISWDHVHDALQHHVREQRALPDVSNATEWARMNGLSQSRIIDITRVNEAG